MQILSACIISSGAPRTFFIYKHASNILWCRRARTDPQYLCMCMNAVDAYAYTSTAAWALASKPLMDASWCKRMHKKYGCLSSSKSDGCLHMYMHAQSTAVQALASKWWMHALGCIWCMHKYCCLSASESDLMQASWCICMHSEIRLFQRQRECHRLMQADVCV